MNLQFYLTESKLSCPGIVIGTFFNYLDFPTHYICGTMNFKKPTHDSWQRDAGYEDSLQSKSPVVDQHLFFILTLIHGQAGGGCWLLHVRERTDWWGPSTSSPAASSRSTHLHLPVSQSLFTFTANRPQNPLSELFGIRTDPQHNQFDTKGKFLISF